MTEKKRPHIIIINPDQMRTDFMHHMGDEAAITPNLDILAQEGVSFANAFCQNPVCTPSRCSFMSGWYPHVRGHRTMHYMMHQDEPVLLKQLKDDGYFVWMQNRNDLIPAQEDRFDELADKIFVANRAAEKGTVLHPNSHLHQPYSFYVGPVEGEKELLASSDSLIVQGAVDFLQSWQQGEQPLCMFIPLGNPHPPYQVEKRLYDAIDRTKLPPRKLPPDDWADKPSILRGIVSEQGLTDWTEEDWQELRTVYQAMCTFVDEQVGFVIQALKNAGIYDDCAIIVLSDHGDYTGDYGIAEKNQNTFEDSLVRVPFLLKAPKDYAVKPGVRTQLVELVDFYATVQELTGFPFTHTQYGKSVLHLLDDANAAHRDAAFAEGGRLKSEKAQCSDVDITKPLDSSNEYYPRLKQQASDGPEHTRATMCRTDRYKYVRRLYERDEFYDLQTDPEERVNLIDNPAYQKEILALNNRMLTWYQETCDAVPLARDQRFNIEMMLSMMGIQLSAEKLAEVKHMMQGKLLNSNTMKEVMLFLRSQ